MEAPAAPLMEGEPEEPEEMEATEAPAVALTAAAIGTVSLTASQAVWQPACLKASQPVRHIASRSINFIPSFKPKK